MGHTVLEPEIITHGATAGRWKVVIFNNDTNSIDEVIEVLMFATQCSLDEAEIETWEAHTFGKAPVHFATKLECDDAASIISSVGIKTEVAKEWDD